MYSKEFPGLLTRPTRRSAVANLRDAFARYCFKCRLEHRMKKREEKNFLLFASFRDLERVLLVLRPVFSSVASAGNSRFGSLVARSYLEWATTGDHQGGVHSFIYFFLSNPLLCGAENAVCVRIKVGLGFRGPPVCSARQRNAKFSQNSLPLPVPGVGVLLGIFSKTRRRLFCVACKITVGPCRQGDASRSQLICTPSLSVYLLPALTEPRGVAPTCLRA